MKRQPLNNRIPNREVGFFYSDSARITELTTVVLAPSIAMRPFMWVEAYFNSTVTTAPILAVWDGESYAADEVTPLVNIARFSYSGQMKPVRGKYIIDEGEDYLGNTITSTDITGDPDTGLVEVYVSGGAGGVSP